jgi:hypothetical protein
MESCKNSPKNFLKSTLIRNLTRLSYKNILKINFIQGNLQYFLQQPRKGILFSYKYSYKKSLKLDILLNIIKIPKRNLTRNLVIVKRYFKRL